MEGVKEYQLDGEESQRGAYSPVCSFCRHYQEGFLCAAFEVIPLEIWEGDNDHRQPYPDDSGIQFEAREG